MFSSSSLDHLSVPRVCVDTDDVIDLSRMRDAQAFSIPIALKIN